ncbi:MAG: NAD(P)/FAD-dependent oxidoreductase [Thaumarchaeota archaeon]|nr:NAD(P)/FAD-dependent oxidoreductase [Nitrososphaerota archaeon]
MKELQPRVDFYLRKEVFFVTLGSILGAFVMFVPRTLLDISLGKEYYITWLVFAHAIGSNSIIVGISIHVFVATIIGIIGGLILYRALKVLNISKISNGIIFGIISGIVVFVIFFIPINQFLLAPNMAEVLTQLDPKMTFLESTDFVQKNYTQTVIDGVVSHLVWGITVGMTSSVLTTKFGARYRCHTCDIQFSKIPTFEKHKKYIHDNPSPLMKRILILGGGFAGTGVLRRIQDAFEDYVDVDIRLVAEDNFLLFTPMLPEISSGTIEPRHITTPVRTFCKRAKFYEATVDSISLKEKRVTIVRPFDLKKTELQYDYLVLAMGSRTNFFGNKNIEKYSMTIKTLGDAMHIRNHILTMLESADQEDDPNIQSKLMTFVVAGGGFSGVETVSEINDFVRESAENFYRNIDNDKIRAILVSAGEKILPEVGPELGDFAAKAIEKAGVEIISKTKIVDAGKDFVVLDNQETISCGTIIWAGGVAIDPVISKLECEHDKIGRVTVDGQLRLRQYTNVFALGDCASINDIHSGKPYPPTAQHAIREARTVAENLVASINGQNVTQRFTYKTKGTMAKIGRRTGVAVLMGKHVSGLVAWAIWRWYYLTNLPTREKMIRVALDWLVDFFAKRDITRLRNLKEEFNEEDLKSRVSSQEVSTVKSEIE